MRVCWNWQTGTFEGRVLHDVRVQVPSLAPGKVRSICPYLIFYLNYLVFIKNGTFFCIILYRKYNEKNGLLMQLVVK